MPMDFSAFCESVPRMAMEVDRSATSCRKRLVDSFT